MDTLTKSEQMSCLLKQAELGNEKAQKTLQFFRGEISSTEFLKYCMKHNIGFCGTSPEFKDSIAESEMKVYL